MDDRSITLREVNERSISYVESLLERNGLPAADVREKRDAFYLASVGDERVGIGGVEVHGTAGLLRSVVVEAPARGDGIGTALCERLEERASAEGVGTLYLLTTTASGFFEELGYVETDREDVPASIRETTQFAELCPSTAACLSKSL